MKIMMANTINGDITSGKKIMDEDMIAPLKS